MRGVTRHAMLDPAQWHRWFAWYPVRTSPELLGSHYRWLRFWWMEVERRLHSEWWGEPRWEYRLPEQRIGDSPI